MAAYRQVKRGRTAREAATALNCSPRTIRKWVAQPRADYLAEAEARRKTVIELKRQGLTRSQIAEHMGITANAVKCLYKRAKKAAKTPQP
jgi:transposase